MVHEVESIPRKMNYRRLYLVALLICPVLGLYLNGLSAAFLLITASAVTLYTMRRAVSQDREIVYLFVVLNQLMFMYCWYYADGQIVISVPDSHLDVSSGDLAYSEPFVSVVLIDGIRGNSSCLNYAETVDELQKTASPVLTREIVAPLSNSSTTEPGIPIVSRLSDSSDMIIFVSCNATFTPNWMVGIVRELFAHQTHIVTPTLYLNEEVLLTGGAMISSEKGLWVLTDPQALDRELPLIPVLSALGVSRTTLNRVGPDRMVQLLEQNKLLEISLLAWFCLDGIQNTSFSRILLRDSSTLPDHDWKSIEGETVDESVIASCNSDRTMEWFYEKFAKYDLDANLRMFQIQVGMRQPDGSRKCLVANYDNSLGTETCENGNAQMLFFIPKESAPSIRPVVFRTMCMDSGSAEKSGSKPILYICIERNRNQMFYFDGLKIRWGSFCLTNQVDTGTVTLEFCKDLDSQIFHPQYT